MTCVSWCDCLLTDSSQHVPLDLTARQRQETSCALQHKFGCTVINHHTAGAASSPVLYWHTVTTLCSIALSAYIWTYCLQDVWPALFDDVEDRNMYTALQSQLKYITKMQQRASPALRVLETELISGACHDPGAVIESELVLPLIRERIDAAAQEQAENQSANKVSKQQLS